MGPDECFSAHVVDQAESLEQANLARNCLLEDAGDHLLDGEVEDVDGGEAGEADPVDFLEQLDVGLPVPDETSVCVSDENHPPEETEHEGVEVGPHDHVP